MRGPRFGLLILRIHEEGIDYPEGEPCPLCPFWADRDRFTSELIEDTGNVLASDEDPDDVPVTYSSHCQVLERDGVSHEVQIYRIPTSDWVLEVVNEKKHHSCGTITSTMMQTPGKGFSGHCVKKVSRPLRMMSRLFEKRNVIRIVADRVLIVPQAIPPVAQARVCATGVDTHEKSRVSCGYPGLKKHKSLPVNV